MLGNASKGDGVNLARDQRIAFAEIRALRSVIYAYLNMLMNIKAHED